MREEVKGLGTGDRLAPLRGRVAETARARAERSDANVAARRSKPGDVQLGSRAVDCCCPLCRVSYLRSARCVGEALKYC